MQRVTGTIAVLGAPSAADGRMGIDMGLAPHAHAPALAALRAEAALALTMNDERLAPRQARAPTVAQTIALRRSLAPHVSGNAAKC